MKKIVFLAAALMASMFILTSCEKENVANNAINNVKGANYVLVQKGCIDNHGNVGDLYVDENNPANRDFEIFQQSQAKACQNPTGTLVERYEYNQETGENVFICYDCVGEAKDCWISHELGNNTVHFNTDALKKFSNQKK